MWLTYVLTDLVTGASWFVALSLNTANIVGVLCGWRFLYWQGIQQRGFQRQRAVLIMFCGSLLCAFSSALVGMWPSHVAFDSPMWRVLLMWIATEFYNCVLILPVVLAAPRGWFWRWQNPFRFPSWKYVLPIGALVLAEVFSLVFHGPGAIAFVIPSFLTGALARRALMEHGQKLLNRLQQDKRSVAVLMMDLDHFKQINDRFGHAQGDVVLQKFVELAHGALRPEDLLGRMGGEEFAIVLPGVDAQQAKAIGQRIGSLMREHAFVVEDGQALHVSISIGVCAVSGQQRPTSALEALLNCADEALYQAKESGRDRVCTAELPLGGSQADSGRTLLA